MSEEQEFVKPKCKLVGENGNVFNLASLVGLALKRAGYREKRKEFYDRLPKCKSYDDALVLMQEYVEAY